jgi:hypothetical protein
LVFIVSYAILRITYEEVAIIPILHIQYFVGHEQEGLYLTVPFEMPAEVEAFTLSYQYPRYGAETSGGFTAHPEINIIDLGLIAPDGSQVGASGSDKGEIEVGETWATPGYRPHALVAGRWQIVLGAYKIAAEGVNVSYELRFTPKRMRLLKGDLHTHTLASDGVLTAAELGQHARRHGLDFVAITDHNQMVAAEALPHIPGLTLIPGIEWTHYQGHANFTGVDQPYEGTFIANSPEEVRAHFTSARERGALITINHPFEEGCPFRFDLNALPFDCIEIWNGPMRLANLQALGLWHKLLCAGQKIAACGGSDYHRNQLFLFPGGPTTCVYAPSASAADILAALRQGHAYIVYAPDGPTLEMTAGEAMMGDNVVLAQEKEIRIKVNGLHAGDVLQVVTGQGSTPLVKAAANGDFEGCYPMSAPGFARVEILREFAPGLPMLPALISNPIYFE